ncbi:MAG: hypothetical protein A2252_04610 [Elusimicrobia bacterium RIFOXYA2_FULL_39_19]|nr:MAG: hypothetical protein A2252_04610 [Elusimicrobia bacterium RIFOXYA2_FULL_39_19]
MKEKQNCWEFMNCERQPSGAKVTELGVCPATRNEALNADNSGKKAGRTCWVVAGTFCSGKVQGRFAAKLESCINCEFYKKVKAEEGAKYKRSGELLRKLAELK